MKKMFKRLFIIAIFVLIVLLTCNIDSMAATAGISASSTKVSVGDSVNINVSANAATWNLKVNGSGVSDSIVGVNMDVENQATNKSYKLDTSKAGTYTITLSGDITDADGTPQKISQTTTVTVEEKVTEPAQEPKKEETPKETPKETTQETPQETKKETPKEEPKQAEPKFKDVNELVYVDPQKVNSVNVRQGYTTSTTLLGSIKAGESVTRTGIGDNGWSRVTYNGKTAYIITSALTTTKPEEKEEVSTNKALKELTVEGYELTPTFDPETTSYSLKLKEDDKKLNIKATPADENARVEITGNENFENSNNTVRITVTAQDGTQRIYRITVLKENEEKHVVEMVRLKNLQIANTTLNPEFNPDTVSYIIEVDDPSTVKAQDVVATAEDADVKVTIAETAETSGNGEKKITIVLEKNDGSITTTYEIFVKKHVANQLDNLIQNKSDKTIYMILGSIMAVLLILIIVIIVILKKSSNGDGDEDEEAVEEDEMSDDYSLNNTLDQEDSSEDSEYDDMLKESTARTQILSTDYNVFKDNSNDVGINQEEDTEEDEDVSENGEEDMDDGDLEFNNKKKGKHF